MASRTRRHPGTPRTGIGRLVRPLVVVPALVVVGAAVGGGALLAQDDPPSETSSAPTEQVVDVTVEDLSQTISAEGTIEAATTSDLAFSVSGTVTEVLVAAGGEVAAGAPVARIDSSELEAALLEAQAAVDDADAARAEVADDGEATEAELTARETQLASAEATRDDAYEALAGATLTSPIAGTVASVGYQVGDVLGTDGADGTDVTGSDTGSGQPGGGDDQTGQDGGSGTTAGGIQVVSTGTYVVTVDVDATEVDQIAVGQVARVTPTTSSSSSDTSGGAFPGMGGGPMAMGPMASSESGDGGATIAEAAGDQVDGTVLSVGAVASADSGVATFPVDVVVAGSPDEFFPGAVGQVEVVYDEIVDAVTVPAMAVSQVDGQATVTVADGDDRVERAVTTGITSGTSIQVVDGLEAGEQVVISRPSFGGDPRSGGEGGGSGPAGAPGDLVVEGGPAGATDEAGG